jgi:hypothetical protein
VHLPAIIVSTTVSILESDIANCKVLNAICTIDRCYAASLQFARLAGHFGPPALALLLAGRFAAQGRKPATIGTLPCDTLTFGVLTLAVVVLVGVLCFLPTKSRTLVAGMPRIASTSCSLQSRQGNLQQVHGQRTEGSVPNAYF